MEKMVPGDSRYKTDTEHALTRSHSLWLPRSHSLVYAYYYYCYYYYYYYYYYYINSNINYRGRAPQLHAALGGRAPQLHAALG